MLEKLKKDLRAAIDRQNALCVAHSAELGNGWYDEVDDRFHRRMIEKTAASVRAFTAVLDALNGDCTRLDEFLG